jgi:hypothetical protein
MGDVTYTKFWSQNLKERAKLEYKGVDVRKY